MRLVESGDMEPKGTNGEYGNWNPKVQWLIRLHNKRPHLGWDKSVGGERLLRK